jgi:hypothetical protein
VQLCEVLFKAYSGEPNSCKLICREYAEAHVEYYTELGTATGIVIDDMAGTKAHGARRTTDLTLTASYQDVLTWSVKNARPGTFRKIECDVDAELTETTTTRVAFDLLLAWSTDGTNWTTLKLKRVDIDVTGATGNKQFVSVPFMFLHSVAVDNVYNVTKTIQYRLQARLVAGDTLVINGSASSAITNGTVTVLNP